MSLRRPFRESWDSRESKRIARSRSSTVKPRGEVRVNTHISITDSDSETETAGDDDYPGMLASTPEPEEIEIPRGQSLRRDGEQDSPTSERPSVGNSPVELSLQIETPQRTVVTKRVHFDENPPRSISAPPEFDQDLSPTKTNLNPLLKDINDEKKEREYLHSKAFPIETLRPVPTLNQMVMQLTPAMGDPGTAFSKFGPRSPQKPLFAQQDSNAMFVDDPDPLSQGFLKDRLITSHRTDRLLWKGKTGQVTPYKGKGYEIRLPTAAEMRHDKAAAKKWTGRKYSIDANMKTRHMAFDILKWKINHHELLSLNLTPDARRDALKIGGGEIDIGGSLHTDYSRSRADHHTASGASRSRERARQSSISTSMIPSSRTSTFAAKFKAPKAETFFTPPLCCNPACVHCQHHVPQSRAEARARQPQLHGQKSEHGDMISTGGYDTREQRLRAQDIDGSLDAGRYGLGGTMLWRLVKVTGLVEIEGKTKEQCAWYVVPDRVLGGFF